ncbi:MAG: ATP-binding cassette domain-containing protein [Fidelibacterota bacterium]|nr:MAG: ATP-binding cassette domain-containing protein [Candidatus Neomarinimicrobiota bacterium]
MLTLDSVWKSAPDQSQTSILQDCTYTFEAERIYAILGTSGVGKTILLRTLNNLAPIDQGRILLRDRDIAVLHPVEVRRSVSILFQTPAFVGTTVAENLAFARRFSRRIEVDFTALLERVHLDSSFLDRPVANLSVGQQQRVCLARTLATQPEVLLLDEPTSALDDNTAGHILELVREINDREKLLTIFVTHRRSHARKLGQVILELADGKLKELS